MGKKQHLFTPWFRLSIEKVNSTHKGAACRSCIKANPNKPIEDLYFTNKKETCLNHLKHCKHFKEEIAKLIFEQKIKELQKFFDHYHSESALPFEESGITMPENLISSWVEMTEEEEFDILEDNSSNSNNFIDFHEISNNSPLSDPNILQRTYPADDQNAKWKMENLFVEDLEPPFLL
ncbi:13261_t:CDS:2 [Entrophospora sp. SA101]|nr:13261_t:CDS:2 [Entrophospora sp. SA101]